MIVRHLGHVLVTGATGFLGAYLINELTGYTDKITCVVRGQNKKDARQLVEENLSCYFDPAHVADLMIRVEVVLGE
ncbi:SDR family oxidoreductase, partial [Lactobacillus crispatus]